MKTIYTGIFFDEKTKNELKEFAQQIFSKTYENIQLDHVTLNFGDNENFNYEKEIAVYINGYCSDDRIQVFTVDFNLFDCSDNISNIENMRNKKMHITVSHNSETKPKYSNELLQNKKSFALDKSKKIIGTIKKVTNERGTFKNN